MNTLRAVLRSRVETIATMTCVTRQVALGTSALKIRDALLRASDDELADVAPQLRRAIDLAGRFVRTEGGVQ